MKNNELLDWIALRACVMVEQNNICAMCGKTLKDSEFTVHHIIPRSKNGKDELSNLIGLCANCHNIVEEKQLSRYDILNYHNVKDLELPRKLRYVSFNQKETYETEYPYPEEIILKEKFIIPVVKEKPIVKERPTKYVLKYNMSLKEIAETFGVTRATIHNWQKVPAKKAWMINTLNNLIDKE